MGSHASPPKQRYEEGTVLLERYKIDKRLGSGPHAEVYQAQDLSNQKTVAIKIEHPIACLRTEHDVFRRFCRKSKYSCSLFDYKETSDQAILVMELLGPDFAQVRRSMPSKVFPLSLIASIGTEMVRSLRDLHDLGYVHRDIKPSNFIRRLDGSGVVLVDFGVARLHLKEGTVRERREKADFRGTVKYASYNAHLGKDLSRRDDMFSLFFVLVEFTTGKLLWANEQDRKKVGRLKFKFCSHLQGLPEPLQQFCNTLRPLKYADRPPYDHLEHLLGMLAVPQSFHIAPLKQTIGIEGENAVSVDFTGKDPADVFPVSPSAEEWKSGDETVKGVLEGGMDLEEVLKGVEACITQGFAPVGSQDSAFSAYPKELAEKSDSKPELQEKSSTDTSGKMKEVVQSESPVVSGLTMEKAFIPKTLKRKVKSDPKTPQRPKRQSRRSSASNYTVGTRISVFWPEEETFFQGTVSQVLENGQVCVDYDDGDKETLDLSKERYKLC